MSKSRHQSQWFDEDDLEYERDRFNKAFGKKKNRELDKLEQRRQEQRKAQQSKANSFDIAVTNEKDWN
jgi:hypothetical protein